MTPIIDLHCDLLLYLAEKEGRSPENLEARCALPQLLEGGVELQTLAIYTATQPGSRKNALKQIEKYKSLKSSKCKFLVAVENASGLLEEEEEIDLLEQRLNDLQREVGPPLYISMTWHHENRFGGGNMSQTGIKKDGIHLLELLHNKKIAIDLSHTSDQLAHDILDTIDNKKLKITPIASHSNFRKVTDHPRNLPDDLAKEIVRRHGVIGLNLVSDFIGTSFEKKFVEMATFARRLGAIDHLCFGADFFFEGDGVTLSDRGKIFEEDFGNSGCYPKLLRLLQQGLTSHEIQGIAHRNALNYLARV